MQNIYISFLDNQKTKKPLALGTIIETKGSTPQIPGASALFSPEGLVEGTLGGGKMEADAEIKALESIKNKQSLLYTQNLFADISSKEEAICGGEAKILIDAQPNLHNPAFQALQDSFIKRKPGILASLINRLPGGKISIKRSWVEKESTDRDNLETHLKPFKEKIAKSFEDKKPLLFSITTENFFYLEPVLPLPRLIIAGAGHIGKALSHLGNLLDFEVTVIDDRVEFANKDRLPDADHIIVQDIGTAIQELSISDDTYLVIVTRGHNDDSEALKACIDSDAAYIGMIGSARKIELMRKEFIQKGWATPKQIDRVQAPIGIPIQSKTVEEIAVSIAAQLVLVRSPSQIQKKESV